MPDARSLPVHGGRRAGPPFRVPDVHDGPSRGGHARYHRPGSTRSHAPMTTRLALATALALAAGSADARWSVVTETFADAAAGIGAARVENASGHSFRIYRNGGVVRAILGIDKHRLEGFAPDHCPTLQVDDGVPVVLPTGGTSCLLDATRARFSLGRIENGSIVVSDVLLELMNGNRLIFRYRTRVGDYRETEFTLLGSMQAVSDSLGTGVTVSGAVR